MPYNPNHFPIKFGFGVWFFLRVWDFEFGIYFDFGSIGSIWINIHLICEAISFIRSLSGHHAHAGPNNYTDCILPFVHLSHLVPNPCTRIHIYP